MPTARMTQRYGEGCSRSKARTVYRELRVPVARRDVLLQRNPVDVEKLDRAGCEVVHRARDLDVAALVEPGQDRAPAANRVNAHAHVRTRDGVDVGRVSAPSLPDKRR